jgi:hypothetical protein
MTFTPSSFNENTYLKVAPTYQSGVTDAIVDVFVSYTPGVEGEISGTYCSYSAVQNTDVYIYKTLGTTYCPVNQSIGTYYINIKLTDGNSTNTNCGSTATCTVVARGYNFQ